MSGNIRSTLPVMLIERRDSAMRLGAIAAVSILGALAVASGVAISTDQARSAVQPVLQRMLSLENPVVLSTHMLPLGHVPSPTMRRRLWKAELQDLARTFVPGSPLYARDRHIYDVTMRVIRSERITRERVRVHLQSVVALGPWARATWRATVAFAQGAHATPVINGEAGAAFFRRMNGQWRVVTYSEHYSPRQGP